MSKAADGIGPGLAQRFGGTVSDALRRFDDLNAKPFTAVVTAAATQSHAAIASLALLLASLPVLRDRVDLAGCVIWVSCLVVCYGARARLAPRFAGPLEPGPTLTAWSRRLAALALGCGLVWAALPWLLAAHRDVDVYLYVLAVLLGCITAGCRSLFIHPPSFLLFALPIMISSAVCGLFVGMYGQVLSLLSVVVFLPTLMALLLSDHDNLVRARADAERLDQLVENERQRSALLQESFETLKSVMVELDTAREQAAEAERLGAVTRMLAGVAHVINTPVGTALTAITHLEEVKDDVEAALNDSRLRKSDFDRFFAELRETLPVTRRSLERAAALMDEFKQAVADTDGDSCTTVNVARSIDDAIRYSREQLDAAGVRVDLDLDRAICIDSYPAHLVRVLRNIIENACAHAFPMGWPDPRVTVTLAVSKEGIVIRIVDNGIGMAAEVLAQARDPFFTTSRGRGTGLGLYYVDNTVKVVLGGTLSIESAEGQGTQVAMLLPMLRR